MPMTKVHECVYCSSKRIASKILLSIHLKRFCIKHFCTVQTRIRVLRNCRDCQKQCKGKPSDSRPNQIVLGSILLKSVIWQSQEDTQEDPKHRQPTTTRQLLREHFPGTPKWFADRREVQVKMQIRTKDLAKM
jgi:hypothetical protein